MSAPELTDSSQIDPHLWVPGDVWADMGERPHDQLISRIALQPIVFLENHHAPGHSPNGTWAVTSAELARQVLLDTDTFTSTNTTSLSTLLGGLNVIPIEADPPHHAAYRGIVSDFFKPKSALKMTDLIRAQAEQLVDEFRDDGHCEFVQQFGKVLPAIVFLPLYGLPASEKAKFLEWSNTAVSSPSAKARVDALSNIRDLIADELEERRKEPCGDILSTYAQAKIGDRSLTREETLGGLMLLFTAGLDTTAALLGWTFKHLAECPTDQLYLRENPDKLDGAIDEFLRYFSSVTVTRRATRDIEIGGAQIRRGDTVICPTPVLSRDANEFENAGQLEIRKGSRRHFAFGYGVHLCLGMHLAKLEIRLALESWFANIPHFRIDNREEVISHGGAILALDQLPLRWD